MNSLATEVCTTVGALCLLAFAVIATLRINQNRRSRDRSRKLASRILNWKSPD